MQGSLCLLYSLKAAVKLGDRHSKATLFSGFEMQSTALKFSDCHRTQHWHRMEAVHHQPSVSLKVQCINFYSVGFYPSEDKSAF